MYKFQRLVGLHALLAAYLLGVQHAEALEHRPKNLENPVKLRLRHAGESHDGSRNRKRAVEMKARHARASHHRSKHIEDPVNKTPAVMPAIEKEVNLPVNMTPAMMPAIEGEVNLYPDESRTRPDVFNLPLPPEGHEDMFMFYMPDHNVVFCGCAKCGTTSFYRYLYQLEFGKPWEYGDTAPYVQDLLSERWQGKIVNISTKTKQREIMKSAYSFALVRDPKERLVSSWKSKIACNNEYGVDTHDRSYFVHDQNHTAWPRGFVFGVQRLYGAEENFTCLDLPTFVHALGEIKKWSRTKYLDHHFLPQHDGCFYEYPPSSWSRLATISQQDAFDELAQQMGSDKLEMISSHESTKDVTLTPELEDKIDFFTKDDYDMLGSYLPNYAPPNIVDKSYAAHVAIGQYAVVVWSLALFSYSYTSL